MRCVRYQVIHDLLSTNVRPYINMTPSNTSPQCASTDTLEHHLTACCEGQLIWNHVKTLLARMLRTSPTRIPEDWLLRPHFNIWPPKRNRAVLWNLANAINFRLHQLATPTLKDFIDFLLRSRWKLMNKRWGRYLVGNYLIVLDPFETDARRTL